MIHNSKKKIVVIYHGGCPDGFSGAWAAWKKFGNRAEYIGAYDRLALPHKLTDKEVYLIDYTYKPDLVKKLTQDNRRVTAIDHHITAEAAVKLTHHYSFMPSAVKLFCNFRNVEITHGTQRNSVFIGTFGPNNTE